ncbi:hypothetical protein DXG01_007716 [Tephrocybe rancida]|nr:hypothetical protein DXG01_007716 [Tephrocybe rancida]
MPGNHEFAMRPPPAGRGTRKSSLANGGLNGAQTQKEDEVLSPVASEPVQRLGVSEELHKKELESSLATPIPTTVSLPSPAPTPSPPPQPALDPTTPTPTPTPAPTPAPPPTNITTTNPASITIPSPLPSPSPSTKSQSTPQTQSPAPTPNRRAPPSPAASRRVSSMSTFSTRSRTPSTSAAVSRAGSTRRPGRTGSTSVPAPQSTSTPPHAAPPPALPRVLIVVRDFAYDRDDERFHGKGASVPRVNHLAVLHRKLAGLPDEDDEEVGGEDLDSTGEVDAAWDLLRRGWGGGFGASSTGANGWGHGGAGPSQAEMDLNFGGHADDVDDDGEYGEEEEGDGEEEEPLYPGLYRAMYAFEPEGTAEMALTEDQVVRVVGRGGGVGWAVVLVDSDDSSASPEIEADGKKHALVPESYLEPVRLDWEDEESA